MSDYPIIQIDISLIKYLWESPRVTNKTPLIRHGIMEEVAAGLVADNMPQPFGKILESVKQFGMVNPLIVGRQRDETDPFYYTIIGNQRLSILRGTGHIGDVPCRMALPGDLWNDDTQARKLHPYEVVEL